MAPLGPRHRLRLTPPTAPADRPSPGAARRLPVSPRWRTPGVPPGRSPPRSSAGLGRSAGTPGPACGSARTGTAGPGPPSPHPARRGWTGGRRRGNLLAGNRVIAATTQGSAGARTLAGPASPPAGAALLPPGPLGGQGCMNRPAGTGNQSQGTKASAQPEPPSWLPPGEPDPASVLPHEESDTREPRPRHDRQNHALLNRRSQRVVSFSQRV